VEYLGEGGENLLEQKINNHHASPGRLIKKKSKEARHEHPPRQARGRGKREGDESHFRRGKRPELNFFRSVGGCEEKRKTYVLDKGKRKRREGCIL